MTTMTATETITHMSQMEKALTITPATQEFSAAKAELDAFIAVAHPAPRRLGWQAGLSAEVRNDLQVLRRRVNDLESKATHYCPECGTETAGLLDTLDGIRLRLEDFPGNLCPPCKAEDDEWWCSLDI